MSSIAITGGATGTGVFSLLAPSTSTNRTLTLPDSAGTVATAESTLSQFNASGSAPVYACRAWVIFNGTGTIAILGSGNVSSITDGGAGTYTINFTTDMPDANYNAVGMSDRLGGTRTTFACKESTVAATASAFRFGVFNTGNTATDSTFVGVSIFR